MQAYIKTVPYQLLCLLQSETSDTTYFLDDFYLCCSIVTLKLDVKLSLLWLWLWLCCCRRCSNLDIA